MDKRLKNFITFGLTFTFLFASVYCCCIPDKVKAAESMPECHKAAHQDSNTSQNHNEKDCDCHRTLSILIEKTSTHFDLASIHYNFTAVENQYYTSYSPALIAYQAPPYMLKKTIPLYLQNSTLRV